MKCLKAFARMVCLQAISVLAMVSLRENTRPRRESQFVLEPEPARILSADDSTEFWNVSIVEDNLLEAMQTMQSEFFQVWLGQWPTSIDWTGAVLETHISATLNTLSRSKKYRLYPDDVSDGSCVLESLRLEDTVNTFFSQISAYYFGQNHFGIRFQAHDDMLWVNLGWLEALRLIDSHNKLHYQSRSWSMGSNSSYGNHPWHGTLFKDAFAHRAHVFYDLVAGQWDRLLCGGGLNWNPVLEVYKNTVTNTQFISAAVGMYLYHPGDDNRSPLLTQQSSTLAGDDGLELEPSQPHDPEFLSMAQEAYQWLRNINMTNDLGLYVDGYHLRSWFDPIDGHREYGACDQRNEMVYTYNQGVILSGLRQLWESTGNTTYLTDAHALVRDVISATGWPDEETAWRGLGHSGILTEFCDPLGICSQDAQTFKGIFFHHLATLCEPLPTETATVPGLSHVASDALASLHAHSCRSYIEWVEHNARGAWRSRDEKGTMGTWWGAPDSNADGHHLILPKLPEGADDWRNANSDTYQHDFAAATVDWNARGRGRTVESHSGGLAALRALYALHVFYD